MAARNWATEKRWSDIYLNEIKSILGVYLIGEPPIEEDMQHNTDLISLRMEPVRVACRVRRAEYLKYYSDQFTIREGFPSGAKSELPKIVEGWGDYFFYAFGGNDGRIVKWTLADLKVFRATFNRYMAKNKGALLGSRRENHGESDSYFRAFSWSMFPPEFIVAREEAI